MELISKSQLAEVRSTFERTRSFSSLNESINLKDVRGSFSTEVTIFLSHKHGEKRELENAIALLKSVNVNVYVDWTDSGMPKTTSGATATRLKNKIKSSKKFILLATEQAINSKWCNWELGIGDVHKYIKDIALLVVTENHTAWSGTEYLQIYPVIGLKYNFSNLYYEVQFPDGTTVDLLKWLNS